MVISTSCWMACISAEKPFLLKVLEYVGRIIKYPTLVLDLEASV